MKVQLERRFDLPAAADAAWALLQDIEAVAGCMPGARITEATGPQSYKGTVSVRVGPASMAFRGEVQVVSCEAETRTLRLAGKGTDSTGSSGASLDLTARIEPAGAGACALVGNSEVSISGKAAAFGGRLIDSVADQLLKQFAANFAARLPAQPAAAAAADATAATAATTDADPAAPAPPAAAPPAATPPPTELNAVALLWAVLKDWLRALLGLRKA